MSRKPSRCDRRAGSGSRPPASLERSTQSLAECLAELALTDRRTSEQPRPQGAVEHPDEPVGAEPGSGGGTVASDLKRGSRPVSASPAGTSERSVNGDPVGGPGDDRHIQLRETRGRGEGGQSADRVARCTWRAELRQPQQRPNLRHDPSHRRRPRVPDGGATGVASVIGLARLLASRSSCSRARWRSKSRPAPVLLLRSSRTICRAAAKSSLGGSGVVTDPQRRCFLRSAASARAARRRGFRRSQSCNRPRSSALKLNCCLGRKDSPALRPALPFGDPGQRIDGGSGVDADDMS